MEMIDIYDRAGNRTGRSVPKGTKLAPDECRLHAIVLLVDQDGQCLLQQRSLKARYSAGKWDVTGGGVTSGESSHDAAIRETFEELGLRLDPEKMVFAGRSAQPNHYFFDMWGAKLTFGLSDCSIDPCEVNGVKMVSFDEFKQTIAYNKDAVFMALIDKTYEMLQSMA